MYRSRGGAGGPDSLWKIPQSSFRLGNAISMMFCWQVDDGPLRVVIQSPSSLCKIWWLKQNKYQRQTKVSLSKILTTTLRNLSDPSISIRYLKYTYFLVNLWNLSNYHAMTYVLLDLYHSRKEVWKVFWCQQALGYLSPWNYTECLPKCGQVNKVPVKHFLQLKIAIIYLSISLIMCLGC